MIVEVALYSFSTSNIGAKLFQCFTSFIRPTWARRRGKTTPYERDEILRYVFRCDITSKLCSVNRCCATFRKAGKYSSPTFSWGIFHMYDGQDLLTDHGKPSLFVTSNIYLLVRRNAVVLETRCGEGT